MPTSWADEEAKLAVELAIQARKRLLLRDQFLSTGAMNLDLRVATPEECAALQIVDAACDARHILINPRGFAKIPPGMRVAAVAHETLHCVLKHIFRSLGKEQQAWNRACDIVVNGILRAAGFEVGTVEYCRAHELGSEFEWTIDAKLEGKSAEEIYQLFIQDGETQGSARNLMSAPIDVVRHWHDVAIMAAEAARMLHGSLPYGLEDLIERATKPRLGWRQRLPIFLGQYAKADWTWCPPDNRFVHRKICLPSISRVRIGRIILVVDTSGSMSDRQIAEALGVMASIIALTRHQVDVVCCDVTATLYGQFTGTRQLPKFVPITGRGGTDFRGAFDWVTAHTCPGRQFEDAPAAMVYFTDGEGQYPTRIPSYPVMWVLTGHGDRVPPFGQVTYMDDM